VVEHPLGKVMNARSFNDLRVVVVGLDGAITGRIVVSLYSIDEHTERAERLMDV
jgi:hypothetical protein